jgi:hypothetical protein
LHLVTRFNGSAFGEVKDVITPLVVILPELDHTSWIPTHWTGFIWTCNKSGLSCTSVVKPDTSLVEECLSFWGRNAEHLVKQMKDTLIETFSSVCSLRPQEAVFNFRKC